VVTDDNCVGNGKKGSSYDCRFSVHKGSISKFPVMTDDGSITDQTSQITYIKLSANRIWLTNPTDYNLADRCYGEVVRAWYEKPGRWWLLEKRADPYFPHYPTFRQEWKADQFLAYVSLGAHFMWNFPTPREKGCTIAPPYHN
jgi:hypothetical protein